MDISELNLKTADWEVVRSCGGAIRIRTSRGVFTISDRDGAVTISTEHQLQIAPLTSNQVAINERRRINNQYFD